MAMTAAATCFVSAICRKTAGARRNGRSHFHEVPGGSGGDGGGSPAGIAANMQTVAPLVRQIHIEGLISDGHGHEGAEGNFHPVEISSR